MQTITSDKVLTPAGIQFNKTLCIEQGVIQRIQDATKEELAEKYAGTLIPGYIDLSLIHI